jgi:SMODS and SLOG-associating 2TM effector domain 1/Protein of unknown function (DUF4231)
MPRYDVMAAPTIPAVEWAWRRQSVWSQTADNLKANVSRVQGLRLGLTVTAGAMALAASQIKEASLAASVTLSVLAAVAVAAAGSLRARQSVAQTRRWTRARSVSEALKTEVYTFLAEHGPDADAATQQRLEAEVQRLEHEAGDLLGISEGTQPKQRGLPAVHDLDSYLDVRVRQLQLKGYYQPRARDLRKRLRWIKGLEVTLALVAAGLAAVAAVAPTVAAWAAVATTGGGAVAAYAAAQRYEFLLIEYNRTASELRRLLERRTSPSGRPLNDRELVDECEQVISVQNQAWMAKWGEERDAT